ncbi:phosphoribosylamine--glycine ligase [Sediminicoccus sp. KRV36]|uniref:phosphoribosylamine--glycine ligase n=1 Tax=Sediminicoccus sp. KRV36 TaxID=3133721 RepID=UPI00200CF609|nr:phosphoribosylamine--glycine ligase [Sediminicoccus rosea]UPY37566.1 phosphoribosylamine--glycine ligase [Sediminicoccus rosea]
MRIFPTLLAPLALLFLTGCEGLEPLVAAPVMDNAECRQEAQRAPERNAARQSNFENQSQVRRLLSEERDAERRLYDACLRRLGLPTPGGVEAIRRN